MIAGRQRAHLILLAMMIVLPVAGCAPAESSSATAADGVTVVAVDGGTYRRVTPARLAEMLAAKAFALINVHTPYMGEIPPTDGFIPYDTIAGRLAQLPPDRSARIFLYCRSGRMSDIAARTLVGLGYTDVWDLAGGMDAWVAAGRQLVVKPQGA
jgi:rhodanese-related sulfurtransferase